VSEWNERNPWLESARRTHPERVRGPIAPLHPFRVQRPLFCNQACRASRSTPGYSPCTAPRCWSPKIQTDALPHRYASCHPKLKASLGLNHKTVIVAANRSRLLGIRTLLASRGYNPRVQIEEFRILLALEPSWSISINGREFLHLPSSEIQVGSGFLRFGRFSRKILEVENLRPDTVRVRARSRLKNQVERLVFYAGDKLPSGAELRKRRTTFLRTLLPAVSKHFGKRVTRQALHSDKRHGVGGAYPRLLVGSTDAVIAVDSDESAPVINGIMRAAIQWSPLAKRRITVVLPAQRSRTIATRLCAMANLRQSFDWLEWDGVSLAPFRYLDGEAETHVHPYNPPQVGSEVARIRALAPELLQAMPHISGRAVSIRFRGLELARITEDETSYPLGEPLEPLLESLSRARRFGSQHPLARAHEEAWLESNLTAQIRDVLPVRQDHIYPQVPSFGDEERKIIDLLAVTDQGRLVVIEIKATTDPELPFQALDYWLAVEHHRKAGDFTTNGYFRNIEIRDEPAILVMVAPLLSFHRSFDRLAALLPPGLPMLQIGVNQSWKREIKVLRRKGALG
jgi:hypothetical protein